MVAVSNQYSPAMIRAGTGIASGVGSGVGAIVAAEQACGDALAAAGIDRADGALVVVSAACGNAIPAAVEAACGALGTRCVAGASAHAVMGAGLETRGNPAVVVLAFAGLDAEVFLVDDLRGEERRAGADIAGLLSSELREEDLLVLMPDGHGLLTRPLLDGVRRHVAPATVVGFGAVEVAHAAALSWSGADVVSAGVSGLLLRPPRSARVGVAPTFRSLGDPCTVTRARGNWLLGLDGRPALEVYRERARAPLAEDLRRASQFLLVAVVRGDEPSQPASLVARNVVGFDEERGAISLPEALRSGDRVAFVLRDEAAAREQLSATFSALGSQPPDLGLYFGCPSAGFGHPGLESGYLDAAYPGAAIAGVQGAFQIGPASASDRGGREELLSYAGILAFIDA
jgi:small ligand-binding sensory domain FIST